MIELKKQLKRNYFDFKEVNHLYYDQFLTTTNELNLGDTKEIDDLNRETLQKLFLYVFHFIKKSMKRKSLQYSKKTLKSI